MPIRVLGPVEVVARDGALRTVERKAREVLAVLTLRRPDAVGVGELTELLWDDPPAAATKVVQSHVSRLRAALAAAGPGTGTIERTGTGAYAFHPEPGALDVDAVAGHRERARELLALDRADDAAAALAEARSVWRGDPELPATVAAAAIATRWAEERRQLTELHLAAVVAGSDPGEAVPELRALTTADPLSERRWELLVAALRRAGRQSDALRAYQRARSALGEVGLEPGPALRRAEEAVLAGGAAVAPAPPDPAERDEEPPPVRYARAGGVNVAHAVFDGGPTDLVVLNPALISIDGIAGERRLLGAIARLRRSSRVVCFDRRGVGLSDRTDAAEPPRLDDWVDDAVAVLDATGTARPVVLANADSCLVALALAAARPERVAGLVLVHGYARYLRGDGYPYGVDPETARATSSDALATEAGPGRFDPLSHVAPSVAADPAFRRWWDAVGRRAASPAAAASLHAVIYGSDVRDRLPAVRAPVLLLHRRTCASCDVGHARYLADHLADARLAYLPGADELWFTGDTEPLHRHVDEFVRRVART